MTLKKKAFLISPSGFSEENNLAIAKKRLGLMNFNCDNRKDLLSRHLSYAGNYKRRADEINEAYASSVDVIFALFGGMGAVHTLQYLNYKLINKSNKVLIGFSDVTILLNSIYQKTGARCFHGMNIGTKDRLDKKTILSFLDALNKKDYSIRIKKEHIFKDGYSKGKIVGGNLELLGRSLGTEFEINTDDKIIFLEDYDMKSWRVFDILWQLKLSGKFNNVKGIILGYFTKCGKNIGKYLREFFKDFNCPIILNQPIGHQQPNITVPIGEKCIIDTKNKFWKIEF